MTSFSAISTSVAETASALSGGMALKPLRLALFGSEGPLMTLLTVTVGGAGGDTLMVLFDTENVSPA